MLANCMLWALAVLGTIGGAYEVRELVRALASRGWPTMPVTVLEVSIAEHHGVHSGTSYEPVVRYRYLADHEREASRVAFGSLRVNHAEAERFIAQFVVGATIPGRVSPREPRVAVLIPGPNRFIWRNLTLFAGLLAIAVLGFAGVLR